MADKNRTSAKTAGRRDTRGHASVDKRPHGGDHAAERKTHRTPSEARGTDRANADRRANTAERITFSPDHSDDAHRLASSPLTPSRDIASLPLPELLLPAGSPDSLAAAIEAGTDAVYFGASAFSARARAVNFTDDEIDGALRLCRAYRVKAYAAVNTRIREAELPEALDLVGRLREAGVDAIITADLGLCALIRETYPDVELHASTQLTPTFTSDALALRDLGFARMVAPREASIDDLGRLCADSPIEIEAFVHGAHCVSLSGQCLMSSLIGARSANRGECAQPCRMIYRLGGASGYLLSLADMCYAADIPAVIASGVRSLKVEGRQKDADYVCGVGKVYRRLLDERRSANEDEIAYLASLFGRGFTDGYLRRSFPRMCGVRESDATTEKSFDGLGRKVPLDAKLTLRCGETPTLTVKTDFGEASASLPDKAEASDGEPLSHDRAKAAVAKLGSTPFILRNFTFDTDARAWLAASEINSLRREAAQKLLDPPKSAARGAGDNVAKAETGSTVFAKADTPTDAGNASPDASESGRSPAGIRGCAAPARTAEFLSLSQITPDCAGFFDVIYLPVGEYESAREAGLSVSLSLPPYMTDADADALATLVKPGDRVLCHSVGQIAWVRSLGATADASLRLNVWNSRTLAELSHVCGAVTVSPELPLGAVRALSAKTDIAAAVYGKLPVMHTVRCMMNADGCIGGGFGGKCGKTRESKPCRAYLTDRTGAKFFICGSRDCTNTIYNTVPLWSADRGTDFIQTSHFIFTDETPERVGEIIRAYQTGDPPSIPVRRLK